MKSERFFNYPARSPYPNLYFEIKLGNAGHIDTYCKYSNITNNVMMCVLNGMNDLSYKEKQGIIQAYNYTGIKIGYSYLFNSNLSFYDLKKPKHYRKFQVIYSRLNELIKSPLVYTHFEYRLNYVKFSEYIKQRYVTRSEYNRLIHLLYFFELITRKEYKSKPRTI